MRKAHAWLWGSIALKVALVGLLLVAIALPDLPQFAGKAMTARALTYPLAAAIVPAGWYTLARNRPYPATVDLLVVLPFFIDTAGNALDLYDSIAWWDDANHFVNWAILASAFTLAVRAVVPQRLLLAGLGIGFGAVTAIAWELLEFVAFIRDSPERATAYTDTLGDLGLGLSGSILAATALAIAYRGNNPDPPGGERDVASSPA